MAVLIAACGACELFCDGFRMEDLAEREGAGDIVTVPPYKRAFLDNMVTRVKAADCGLNVQDVC